MRSPGKSDRERSGSVSTKMVGIILQNCEQEQNGDRERGVRPSEGEGGNFSPGAVSFLDVKDISLAISIF